MTPRLKTDLDRVRTLIDASRGWQAAFEPHAPATEARVRAWETAHGVTLPEEYRAFLLTIGDGGVMPGSYCDFELFGIDRTLGAETGARPFPITAERFRERAGFVFDPATGEVMFPELGLETYSEYLPPGCLAFGRYPSWDLLALVTSGDFRGSVWLGVSGGVPEWRGDEPQGFLDWFASVLTEFEGGA